MARQRIKVRINWKSIVYIVLALLLVAGIGFGIYTIVDKSKTTEIRASAFSLGGLNANGKYKETKESIYTKDAFGCQGLVITPKFESAVSYEVFYYDVDGNFVSNSGRLTSTYKMPKMADYVNQCRVVITPIEGDEISLLEVGKYANQLTIEVNKTQKAYKLPYRGENKFEYHTNVDFSLSKGVNNFEIREDGTSNSSGLVLTANCTKICVKVKTADLASVQVVFMSDTSSIGQSTLAKLDAKTTIDGDYTYLVLDVPTNCEGFIIACSNNLSIADAGIYVW